MIRATAILLMLSFLSNGTPAAVASDSQGQVGDESAADSRIVVEFDRPFQFAYLAFENAIEIKDGIAHVVAKNGQGGAGVHRKFNLSRFAADSPAMWAKVGPGNQAKSIKMFFMAGETKRVFSYSLENVGQDTFVRILPDDAFALSPAAEEPDPSFSPAEISMLQIQGDWTGSPIDVLLDKIELVAPTPEMLDQRAAYAQRLQQEAERQRRQKEERKREMQELLAGAPHPEDGPSVEHVGAVSADLLAVTIHTGQIVPRPQLRYERQPGDEIIDNSKDPRVLAWERGQIVEAPRSRSIQRQVEGKGRAQEIGSYLVNQNLLAPGPVFQGMTLSTATVDQAAAYRIVSANDPAYTDPVTPTAVYVKAKPTGTARNQISLTHQVYLRLPAALSEGTTYRIEFRGVNTRQPYVDYVHDTRHGRSEAIHVTQIGYRPDDPMKRAYLSLWMGTGSSVSYEVETFQLLDADSHEPVYRGEIRRGFAKDRRESIRGGKNHTQTNVYYLDFADFHRSGEFVVHVPGVGVSYPFQIADDVWQQAFRISMHGFLSHRSGIALGPPFTDYGRPRPMHPDDGAQVFELDVTYWNGEADAVCRSLQRQLGPELDPSRVATYPDAWGGYMDAGDWDRRSQHLTATWEHLELLDLFPDYFRQLSLALPPDEANDNLPDLMNEALWNLDHYRRLQRNHGGVGGGVESTAHPRPGEASWQESLLLGTFAPDPETSLRYAACAARMARLMSGYDPDRATIYSKSSVRAWDWANANAERLIAKETQDPGSRRRDAVQLQNSVRDMRALAAVALYQLTGETEFHDAFQASTQLVGTGDAGHQMNATFAYAMLPDRLADRNLQKKAVAWFEQAARDSLEFAQANAFNMACRIPELPLIAYVAYYSVPETSLGAILPRAHFLTGKKEYLRGALAAAQFSAGANPMNMTFTTGVGHCYPLHPLHVDSQHAGIDPPAGITVYGMGDPSIANGSVDWVHTWFLRQDDGSR